MHVGRSAQHRRPVGRHPQAVLVGPHRFVQTTLGDAASPQPVSPEELIALDEALDRLGAFDRRLRDVVEYRYFGGLTDAEVAEALGVTERTVQRDWKRARALLHADLYPEGVTDTGA